MSEALKAFRIRLDLRDESGADGPLSDLTFAAKDVFDIAGLVTGGGNPDWLASHEPAVETAPAVQSCLSAGAHLVGITIADEICFSPFGENAHYGTPLNPEAPDRVPGGSSSGSGSATASGLVDFALGTDTGGSVRIPASYCGLFGIRPTHGRVPAKGVVPLSPSFDAVGWLAREASILERVGNAILDEDPGEAKSIRRILLLEDAFELADPRAQEALEKTATAVSKILAHMERTRLGDGYSHWLAHMDTIRTEEIWAAHGEWIERVRPHLGSQTAARFAAVKDGQGADTSEAREFRRTVSEEAADLLGDDTVFMLPPVPGIAPKKGITDTDAPALRDRIFRISCIASMLGFPQISMPLATVDGCPMGLSLLGPRNSERMLLDAAVRVARSRIG